MKISVNAVLRADTCYTCTEKVTRKVKLLFKFFFGFYITNLCVKGGGQKKIMNTRKPILPSQLKLTFFKLLSDIYLSR